MDAITDLELFEDIVLDLEPSCESRHHGTGDAYSCHHYGPAEWYQIGPCNHTTGFRCDRIVQHIFSRELREGDLFVWNCSVCKIWAAPGKLIYIP